MATRAALIAAACAGKLRHATKTDALKAIRAMNRGGRLRGKSRGCKINVYHCPHCDGWHRGSLTKGWS